MLGTREHETKRHGTAPTASPSEDLASRSISPSCLSRSSFSTNATFHVIADLVQILGVSARMGLPWLQRASLQRLRARDSRPSPGCDLTAALRGRAWPGWDARQGPLKPYSHGPLAVEQRAESRAEAEPGRQSKSGLLARSRPGPRIRRKLAISTQAVDVKPLGTETRSDAAASVFPA